MLEYDFVFLAFFLLSLWHRVFFKEQNMSIGLKNWLFPTISFVAFLYVMLLLGIWTYRVDANKPLFSSDGSSKGVTTLKDFKQEMQGYVK